MCHTEIMRKLMVLVVCAVGFSQEPQPPGVLADKDSVITTTTTVVIAPTTVRDRHGEYINGLQLQDFTLYDNNKAQKITADVRDEPLSIVITVQRSSNLTEILPKIQRIGSMLNDLVVGQGGEAAVVSFDNRISIVQDFTGETAKISEAMKRIKPGGYNHQLNDAVVESIRMLKRRPIDRRRVLLLISEKSDKASENRLREVLTEAQFANVSIYCVDISGIMAGLTSQADPGRPPAIPTTAQHMAPGGALTPTTVDQNYNVGNAVPLFVDIFKAAKGIFVDDSVEVLTRFTGGKQYSFVRERGLELAVQGISEELHSQYLLSYTPNNQNVGGFHDIKVVVNRPDLEVRTRPGYWVAGRPE